ncbi:uncharacterized protein LOC107038355 [Diachasma alloeum]|uniref:uncharacterized protein LOC107038355 n=1 Tax=Diachasma alloeum TaxID=454923 RepID=UPI0007385171|nr:uncharacterized protein LOC107038355 [Diachasma alloeum]
MFSVILISIAWVVEASPISNRSPVPSRYVETPSRGYLPSRNTKSTQRLGYHYGYESLQTGTPVDVVPVEHEYIKNPFIPVPNSPTEVEPSRPVYKIIKDEYSPSSPTLSPVKIHSAGQTLVTPVNIKNQKYHPDIPPNAVATAITTLDWLLENKGYNSPIHPPPSPVIALVLSQYGRYLPITRGPRVYSYMAVNNIHNNQPFGQYKWETDENG